MINSVLVFVRRDWKSTVIRVVRLSESPSHRVSGGDFTGRSNVKTWNGRVNLGGGDATANNLHHWVIGRAATWQQQPLVPSDRRHLRISDQLRRDALKQRPNHNINRKKPESYNGTGICFYWARYTEARASCTLLNARTPTHAAFCAGDSVDRRL